MAVFTNAGLNLVAAALQNNGNQSAVGFVSVGLGAGILTSQLTSGTPYTQLNITAGFTGTISNGQSLTVINTSGQTQVATCNTNTAVIQGNAAVVPINSITPVNTFAIGSGVTNTPAATDTAMQSEQYRVAAAVGVPGASTGESLNSGYIDPTAPTGSYVEVGYWGGSAATSSLGTGTLIARDIQLWSHTQNADSATYQLDSIL